jgi:PAS domain S-box-containing protein
MSPPLSPEIASAPIAFLVADGDGRYIEANPAACEMFRVPRERLLELSIFDVTPPESREAGRNHFLELQAKGKAVGEFVLVRPDGTKFWARLTAVRMEDRRLGSYHEDISASKDTEHALLESEKKFRTVVNQLPIGIALNLEDGRITHMNHAALRDLGYTLADCPDLETWFRRAYPDPEYRKRVADDVARTLAEATEHGKPVGPMFYDVRCADGSVKTMEFFHVNLGSVKVWTLNDVTAALKTHQVLTEAKEAAEAANRAKTAFLATVSHELRTPLNPIIGFSDLLLSTVQNPDDREMLRTIHDSGDHLLRLIEELLDFTSSDAGNLKVRPARFSPREVVARSIERLRKKSSAKPEIALRLDVAKDVPETIFADPVRLGQVLDSLLANALKFTSSGSITLDVSRCAAPSGTIRFRVSDTGIGIAPGDIARVFDPFFQAESGMNRRFDGIGIGLSVCKRIADAMGGRLEVSSRHGGGSAFSLVVPEEAPQDAPAEVQRPRPPEKLRVLVAEDEVTNRRVVELTLRHFGLEATFVTNGAQALEAARETAFDLILMDIKMPVMDGWSAIREIRKLPVRAGRPPYIVALTAYASGEDAVRSSESGADEHISKPCPMATLRDLVGRVTAARSR